MIDINQLRRERKRVLDEMRTLARLAESREPQKLTAEEDRRFAQLESEEARLRVQIMDAEKLLGETGGDKPIFPGFPGPASNREIRGAGAFPFDIERRAPQRVLAADDPLLRAIKHGMRGISDKEYRDLSAGGSGGYLVLQEALTNEIVASLAAISDLYASVYRLRATASVSTVVPAVDNAGSDPNWTTELSSGSEDTALSMGQRKLTPHPIAKRIKVSNELLSLRPSVEDLVRELIARKFAEAFENAICNGTGAGQPLGLFTPNDNGIPTSRDFSVGTSSITADKLIEASFTLKGPYLRRAVWIFSRNAMSQIRQLKATGSGEYLLVPGLAGAPMTLLDRPMIVSEYCPSTLQTGYYVGMLADLSYYWFIERLPLQIKLLDQLYAETNQTGFFARAEADGMPVLSEAFLRLKLSS